MKKHEGKIELFVSLYLTIILVLMLMTQLQLKQYRVIRGFVEDALVSSNLASAVADIQEYGIQHHLVIKDPDRAYEMYQEALKINLRLNNSWEYPDKSVITGPVEVLEYIVYNVRGNDVEVFSYTGGGSSSYQAPGGLGSVASPNGILIESTSVYSRIGFPVEGVFGIHIDAQKEKLVDIVAN